MQTTTVPVLAFIQNMSPIQILVIVFLILLLFGAKRLPELGRGMGKFVREFKRTTSEIEADIRSSIDDEPPVRSKPERDKKPERDETTERDEKPEARKVNSES